MKQPEPIPTNCVVCGSVIASGLHCVCVSKLCNDVVRRVYSQFNVLLRQQTELIQQLGPDAAKAFAEKKVKEQEDERLRVSIDTPRAAVAADPQPKAKRNS